MPGRNRFLDLIRWIAVLLVMLHHLPEGAKGDSGLFAALVRGGYCGVDLFFVLSGFLISGLLFSEFDQHGDIRIPRFLVRRAFKLYPAFWVMVAATVVARACFSTPEVVRDTWPRLAAELLFVQNYLPGLWAHTWTLAVEEHFYVFLSCCMGIMVSRRCNDDPFRAIPWLFAATAVLCLLSRQRVPPPSDEGDWLRAVGTHLRADSLMFGVFLRWLVRQIPSIANIGVVSAWFLTLLGMSLLSLAFIEGATINSLRSTWGPTVLYVGAGLIVLASLGLSVKASGVLGFAAQAGADSYSIYLWHLFVFSAIGRPLLSAVSLPPWLLAVTLIVVSSLIGVLMSRFIEQPALRFRDRFFPSRSTNATTPGAWPGVSGRKLGI
jgi:peptidoglycan/LPS O-acetylase OafA/YrhL